MIGDLAVNHGLAGILTLSSIQGKLSATPRKKKCSARVRECCEVGGCVLGLPDQPEDNGQDSSVLGVRVGDSWVVVSIDRHWYWHF